MKSLKYIFLFALSVTIYALVKDYFNKKKETKQLKKLFTNNLKKCIYSPFEKINEPYFKSSNGYLIPNSDNNKDFDLPWKIKTYVQIGPIKYAQTKIKLLERMRVKVINEHLVSRSLFNSFLTIQCLDTLQNEIFIIRGNSFSEIKYWDCPLEQAIQQAPILAQLKIDAEPPTLNGQWLPLSTKSIIICTGLGGFENEHIIGYAYDPIAQKKYYDEIYFKKELLHKMDY